jgi:uncharacterized protein
MEFLIDGPADSPAKLILAHGAGAPMDSAWMNEVAAGIAACGIGVVRFEFPYMRERRLSGKRRPPDRQTVLLDTWREAVSEVAGPGRTFIGGKSMGGRMASMVADEAGVAGLVCLGYPFHAPGRPDAPRVAHLEELRTSALIVQGTSDPFGTREEVANYKLSPSITLAWIEGGNHDLVAKGLGQPASRQRAVDIVRRFIGETG